MSNPNYSYEIFSDNELQAFLYNVTNVDLWTIVLLLFMPKKYEKNINPTSIFD